MAAVKLPIKLSSWETVASIQVFQALEQSPSIRPGFDKDLVDLIHYAGLTYSADYNRMDFELAYSLAYREVDESQLSYAQILAEGSGYKDLQIQPPRFPFVTPYANGPIVIAPFAIKSDLSLPVPVWQTVTNHARTYNCKVLLIGDRSQRQDMCTYTESEILCDASIKDKLEALASAQLVIGVPNAWMWCAAGFDRKIACMYPDHIPVKRWFPFSKPYFGRLATNMHNMHVATMLAGLRLLIAELDK